MSEIHNEQPPYTGPERRMISRSVAEIEEAFDRKLRAHESREAIRFKAMLKQLEKDAFPDGSVAHRIAHQAMIDAATAEKEFWSDLRTDIAKKSIWGILQILTVLAIAGLAAKLGLGAVIPWVGK